MIPAYKKDVNLIPNEVLDARKQETHRRSNTRHSFIFVVIVLVIAGAVFGYSQYLNNQLKGIEAKIAEKEKTIAKLKEFGEDGYNLGIRLESAKEVLNTRHNYSKLVDEIHERTPIQVLIGNYNTGASNEFNISGSSFPNYTPIADFQDNLLRDVNSGNAIFKIVRIGSATYNRDRGSVSFSFQVKIDPESLNELIE